METQKIDWFFHFQKLIKGLILLWISYLVLLKHYDYFYNQFDDDTTLFLSKIIPAELAEFVSAISGLFLAVFCVWALWNGLRNTITFAIYSRVYDANYKGTPWDRIRAGKLEVQAEIEAQKERGKYVWVPGYNLDGARIEAQKKGDWDLYNKIKVIPGTEILSASETAEREKYINKQAEEYENDIKRSRFNSLEPERKFSCVDQFLRYAEDRSAGRMETATSLALLSGQLMMLKAQAKPGSNFERTLGYIDGRLGGMNGEQAVSFLSGALK